MLFTANVNLPPNTGQASPVSQILPIARGIITWVSVFFPGGCERLAHVAILHHEHQIFPSTVNMSLAGDHFPIEWSEYYESWQPPYELKIIGWNEDDTFEHTVTVRIAVLPKQAIPKTSLKDTVKEFLGLAQPVRIYTSE